ncbi:MAG TPA: type I pantothenate kinase, partial [Agromyces sp.]|nr:type I pantothenate kinase [Agromyces sp.]
MHPSTHASHLSPFIELDRADWARLAPSIPSPLRETEIVQLRGLGEPLDLREVNEVYLPLSRLLNLYVGGTKSLHKVTSEFLRERFESTPFVIGVAGSVAVGKSTTSR